MTELVLEKEPSLGLLFLGDDGLLLRLAAAATAARSLSFEERSNVQLGEQLLVVWRCSGS